MNARNEVRYGSDVVIERLRQLGIAHVAMNPGASFRGLHASLVHYGEPELVLALHENVAVAIAHGYAKSSGRPMAVFLHNLVGLQSGALGLFNAWADQVPMVIVGGSGPADTTARRPWLDWVHSTRMQSLVVRDHLKWDDQPASVAALPDSLARAQRIATTVPAGPTYVAVDALLQEQEVEARPLDTGSVGRPGETPSITAPEDTLDEVADLLVRAERPAVLADFTGRSQAAYDALQTLAEALAAPVCDLMARHNFPTGHWADCTEARAEVLADADVVLCLDLRDLGVGLGETEHDAHGWRRLTRSDARVVSISTNRLMLRGFIDYDSHVPGVTDIVADTSVCLPVLARLVSERAGDRREAREALRSFTDRLRGRVAGRQARHVQAGTVDYATLSAEVHRAVSAGGAPWELANGHMRGFVRRHWDLTRFNAHLGRNIGAGLGYGMGVAIGAAIAHRGDGTLVVNLQPDGDLMYTPQALWTSARYRLPVLTVMVNNRSYAQDRMHQTLVAQQRGHPLSNAEVGIDIEGPPIDYALLARAQGVEAHGPVTDATELPKLLDDAVRTVREEQRPVLVDVVVPR